MPEVVNRKSLTLNLIQGNRGEEIDIENLKSRLLEVGFRRVGTVEELGEFATRGGILDLWGYGMEYPCRIEFGGDEFVSIREFDPLLQTSIRSCESCDILPMNLRSGKASILDYLPKDALVVLDGVQDARCKMQDGRWKIIYLGEGYIENQRAKMKDGRWRIENGRVDVGAEPSYQGDIRLFISKIKDLKGPDKSPIASGQSRYIGIHSNWNIYVVCENEIQNSRVLELLKQFEVSGIDIVTGDLSSGFILPDAKLAVFTYSDIFGHKVRVREFHPFKGKGERIPDLTSLGIGDYVVHIDRGIGLYQGIEKLKIRNPNSKFQNQKLKDIEMDFLGIKYKDGDKLFVPVQDFHRVERWIGSGERSPELTRLDSGSWERKLARARKGIQDLMGELLSLYAERKVRKGYKFSQDTVWQAELEGSFPYEETEGQMRVISDIKQDMESDYPMERLVCGEVGYGKTEVALRAAFKVVMNGKQVALLCPTTILVEQHLRTFRERFRDFPIRVEELSRFQKRGEQRKIVELLGRGVVDVVIGTHRLLSKDIKFSALGLLIIDEEHRFGVAQKERLKHIKKDVDILSLTATPIPRTLYMSLARLRDISRLETPPLGRQPIVTQVWEWDDELIEQAIWRELLRGGQVYFVHNRIESIEGVANIIRGMAPEFKVGVAHAELPERELEEVMLRFLDGEFNVLVTTAIIGSGIDIPNVNTILINRADRFGLADLHQLRGRVGRSARRAYCYLLVPRNLSAQARKRVQAVAMHTELGAGFKLAMRDLEFRGAGNLLGREQHGHIHAVGYELYMGLLEEEMKKMKGEKLEKELEPELKLGVSCYIPDWYADPERKLELYKRLAECRDEGCVLEFERELLDRFGPVPRVVKSLLLAAQVKLLAKKRGVVKVQKLEIRSEKLEGYELIFPRLPERLWFEGKKVLYVNSRKEGIGVGIQVNSLRELKELLKR